MAGLQQYNFFPTDFFYPRPKPEAPPANLETSSGKAAVPPQQTPKGDDRNQQQQPTGAWKLPPALVYKQRRQSLNWVSKKKSKFSFNTLRLLTWVQEEEDPDSF